MKALEAAGADVAGMGRACQLPKSLDEFIEGYRFTKIRSGESGAGVLRLSKEGAPGLFLKFGTGDVAQDICQEFVRLRWLSAHIPVPRVEHFVCSGGNAWLLTSAMPGRMASRWLDDHPHRRLEAASDIARFFRKLHAIPLDECPFNAQYPLRLAAARKRLEAGLIDPSDFDEERQGLTPSEVFDQMMTLLPFEPDLVVTHGDPSLDNVLLKDGRVTGVIDVGRAGIADRYQDLAILWNYLRGFDEGLERHLFAAYGIAEPDMRKLSFHLCLEECC